LNIRDQVLIIRQLIVIIFFDVLANLNDRFVSNTEVTDAITLTNLPTLIRSQLGNRDSEIAMMIEDTDPVPSKMNGQDVRFQRMVENQFGCVLLKYLLSSVQSKSIRTYSTYATVQRTPWTPERLRC
jgi:hypothetical protein